MKDKFNEEKRKIVTKIKNKDYVSKKASVLSFIETIKRTEKYERVGNIIELPAYPSKISIDLESKMAHVLGRFIYYFDEYDIFRHNYRNDKLERLKNYFGGVVWNNILEYLYKKGAISYQEKMSYSYDIDEDEFI